MNAIQLDFMMSYEECEIQALREQIKRIEESTGKVRKKLFCENGKHAKIIYDLTNRLEIIERHICKPLIKNHGLKES